MIAAAARGGTRTGLHRTYRRTFSSAPWMRATGPRRSRFLAGSRVRSWWSGLQSCRVPICLGFMRPPATLIARRHSARSGPPGSALSPPSAHGNSITGRGDRNRPFSDDRPRNSICREAVVDGRRLSAYSVRSERSGRAFGLTPQRRRRCRTRQTISMRCQPASSSIRLIVSEVPCPMYGPFVPARWRCPR